MTQTSPSQAKNSTTGTSARQTLVLAAYAMCSGLFAILYFKNGEEYGAATLRMLTDFAAWTPFQYRVLVPSIARVTEAASSLPLAAIYLLLLAGFTFLSLLAFRKLLALFLPASSADTYALMLLYPMTWNYVALCTWNYPYDIPAVFFFILGLGLIAANRMPMYYLVLALATLNRETSCFLIAAYLFTQIGSRSTPTVLAHTAAQAALWVGIKLVLSSVFASNPGDAFQIAVDDNLAHLRSLLALEPRSVAKLLVFGLIWLPAIAGWRYQPLFLRRLMWVVVPFAIGMSVVGVIYELRIYSELIPVVTAPAAVAVHRILDNKSVVSGPENLHGDAVRC